MSVTRLLETSEKMTLKCVGELKLDTNAHVSIPELHLTTTKLALAYGGTASDLTAIDDGQTIVWNNDTGGFVPGFAALLDTTQTFTGAKTFEEEITQKKENDSGSTGVSIHEIQTTTDASTPIASILTSSDSITYFDVKISCCSNTVEDYAAFNLFCVHVNDNGTCAIYGENNEIIVRSDGILTASVDATIANVDENDFFVVNVSGVTDKNLRWNARVTRVVTPAYVAPPP
jgi:hypothetical protein